MKLTAFPQKYLVEKILEKKKNGQVLVKWYGFPEETWEFSKNIKNM